MKKNGFTLIELMVVVIVTIILITFGFAKYLNFNKTQTIKQAGLKLKNDLRDAQGKALSGIKTCSGVLDGYRLDYSLGGNSYSYYSSCSPSNTGTPMTISLPTGVTFSNNGSVFFKSLGLGVNTLTTFCLSGYGKFYKLSVTISGEIQDYGIVATCP